MIITADLSKLTERTALYLIDLISEHMTDPDPFTEACQIGAYNIAASTREVPFGPDISDIADTIYPQQGSRPEEWKRFSAERDAHLRYYGVIKDETDA